MRIVIRSRLAHALLINEYCTSALVACCCYGSGNSTGFSPVRSTACTAPAIRNDRLHSLLLTHCSATASSDEDGTPARQEADQIARSPARTERSARHSFVPEREIRTHQDAHQNSHEKVDGTSGISIALPVFIKLVREMHFFDFFSSLDETASVPCTGPGAPLAPLAH